MTAVTEQIAVDFARQRDLTMRFIEFMPLDADRHWTRELVVPAAEVLERIQRKWKLEPLPHEVARPVRVGHALAPEAIVRRIRTAIAAEAVLARDAGVASEADIDTALWLGAAHPEGPFAWLRRHHRAAGAPP